MENCQKSIFALHLKGCTRYQRCMVAHYYQACFCSLNLIFVAKLNSNSVLNHNFTIETNFKFRFYSQYQI